MLHRRQGCRTCPVTSPQIRLAWLSCLPGHAAWLLGLGSAIQEPAKELAEGSSCTTSMTTHNASPLHVPCHFWASRERCQGAGAGDDGHGCLAHLLIRKRSPVAVSLASQVLEPLSKAREVESAEAESTREAESPRDTDSPVAKTVDQEASYIEGSTSTGDGAEAHISKGGVEETRIICETDPNEVIAWRASQLQLSHDSFFQPAYTVVTMTG